MIGHIAWHVGNSAVAADQSTRIGPGLVMRHMLDAAAPDAAAAAGGPDVGQGTPVDEDQVGA